MNTQTSPAEDPLGPIRPVVRTASTGNLGVWLFLAMLLLGGYWVFQALSSGRIDNEAVGVPVVSGGAISAPPPLSLPRGFGEQDLAIAPPMSALTVQPVQAAQIVTHVVERSAEAPPASTRPATSEKSESGPGIVSAVWPDLSRLIPSQDDFDPEERVTARKLINPSMTIPKGTVITAVLETALNSTRPGAARAIVSRDVMGFDGTRVLIPRGSRLYGEYEADIARGQKRALIRWQRLTRPDAVIIDLDSPSADPLGRAGVEGKVNGHFLARFGSAIMQSVLDIGVGVLTRKATDGVIVALPGSTQNLAMANGADVQPTLTIKQGTSVTVFIARDLDFSTVER